MRTNMEINELEESILGSVDVIKDWKESEKIRDFLYSGYIKHGFFWSLFHPREDQRISAGYHEAKGTTDKKRELAYEESKKIFSIISDFTNLGRDINKYAKHIETFNRLFKQPVRHLHYAILTYVFPNAHNERTIDSSLDIFPFPEEKSITTRTEDLSASSLDNICGGVPTDALLKKFWITVASLKSDYPYHKKLDTFLGEQSKLTGNSEIDIFNKKVSQAILDGKKLMGVEDYYSRTSGFVFEDKKNSL